MDKLNRKLRKHFESLLTNYLLEETLQADFGRMHQSVGSPQLVSQLIQSREQPVKRVVRKMSDERLVNQLKQVQSLSVEIEQDLKIYS
ncbi:hypothetical protein [Lentilactobacillus diolivorans]|uniref:Uncharacterized protein n=2 Tax=Lentilactobacillus diolivorans TaxID=179838 RepID=A0A0R1SRV7_9LACO|nr:hypothetical protein [Lentilactobacillus diolivorans]KRL69218.1 hypothetical protein FC85_GL001577 [Lentilactobacillus diolivorans DSM 14421]GEP23933.1 hypothetical protein LDI01_15260 [Lentilactobacillus diolivorans]